MINERTEKSIVLRGIAYINDRCYVVRGRDSAYKNIKNYGPQILAMVKEENQSEV